MDGITRAEDYEVDDVVRTWDYGIGVWTHERWRLRGNGGGLGVAVRVLWADVSSRALSSRHGARRAMRRIAAGRRLTQWEVQ